MRRKHRGIKLHDIRGWVNRMLSECDPKSFETMSEEDRVDLRARVAAKLLKISFAPRVFLPI